MGIDHYAPRGCHRPDRRGQPALVQHLSDVVMGRRGDPHGHLLEHAKKGRGLKVANVEQVLHQAIQLAKQKRYTEAAQYTRMLLARYPQEDRAWYLLAVVSPQPYQKRMYLRRCLELNPQNTAAQQKLAALEAAHPHASHEDIPFVPLEQPEIVPEPPKEDTPPPARPETIRIQPQALVTASQQNVHPALEVRQSLSMAAARESSPPVKPKRKGRAAWYLLSALSGVALAALVFMIFASPVLDSYITAFGAFIADPQSEDAVVLVSEPTTTPQPSATETTAPTNTITPYPTNTATFTPTTTLTPTATITSTPTVTPEPTNTPLPPLPETAYVSGVRGTDQLWSLSCEASAAVDWARYFGVTIYESEFHNALPVSDDPELGFVGSVHGAWGQIPPYPYGVHAEPVAKLLRAYGLPAVAVKEFSLDDLKREIAEGRPVIIWMIGASWTNVTPRTYTTEAGTDVRVAPYEHVALIVGYGKDYVTIQDGTQIYYRSFETFEKSFDVLNRMVIIYAE